MRHLIYILLPVFFISCGYFGHRVSGNGNIITEKIETGTFQSVSVSGAMNIQVRQDNSTSISIRTDENLIPLIDVYVDGSTLVVREKKGYNLRPSRELIVYVSAPLFREISVSGSGNIISDNKITGNESLSLKVSGSGKIDMEVDIPQVSTRVSGSGTVILSGQSDVLDMHLSGSGDIRCFDLNSDDVTLELSGSADAEVTANKKLEVHVSGSADVLYKGNANVTKHISGSGSVKKAG